MPEHSSRSQSHSSDAHYDHQRRRSSALSPISIRSTSIRDTGRPMVELHGDSTFRAELASPDNFPFSSPSPRPVLISENTDSLGSLEKQTCWSRVPKRSKLFWSFFALAVIAIICSIALAVSLAKARATSRTNGPGTKIIVSSRTPKELLPVAGAHLGAVYVTNPVISTGTPLKKPNIQAVFDAGNGTLCIRTKVNEDGLILWTTEEMKCIEGANPRNNTPVTMLEWLGGPSIYFITKDNYLSGLDWISRNDTWLLSNLVQDKKLAHPQSQLASITWFNGSSAWVYCQSPESRLCEYGMQDHRDRSWRKGNQSPLEPFLPGGGIGLARWVNTTDPNRSEAMEYYVQQDSGAIFGKTYKNGSWDGDVYVVSGTNVASGANLPIGVNIAATVAGGVGGIPATAVLAYYTAFGRIKVQTRTTANVSGWSEFTAPRSLDGGVGDEAGTSGISLISWNEEVTLLYVAGRQIMEARGNISSATNATWSKVSAVD